MNIVVTGATSFIGAPMVDKLIGMGHDVYAVVRPLRRIAQDSVQEGNAFT